LRVLTFGYGNLAPDEFFARLEALRPDLIVDVRADPWHARLGSYTAGFLMKKFPNYVPIPYLGNRERRLPPRLVNEEVGFRQLLLLVSSEWRVFGRTVSFPPVETVVLLCSELDENRCHRKYVKEKLVRLLEKHGVAVEKEALNE